MASHARIQAIHHLLEVEEHGAYVGLVKRPPGESGSRLDERTITEYVSGVTRWKGWLDFLISSFYRADFSALEPTLKQILRLGLYDMLLLDTAPHAVVNESVELAKKLVRPDAGRLVNGILRSVLRQREALPEPPSDDEAAYLAIRFSHPRWMVERWLARYGRNATEALLQWNNARPHFGVRVNRLKISVENFHQRLNELGAEWRPSPYLEDFVRVSRLQPLMGSDLLKQGFCAVQDESAGLIVRVLGPQSGERIVDTCAAPGGKAIYAAVLMQNRGRIDALDIHRNRLRLVQRAAVEQGVTILQIQQVDSSRNAVGPAETAHRALVDAPCSGLGVLGKRADLRWNRTPGDLTDLERVQARLLDSAAEVVRPGGVLVYSTCTIEPEENERQAAAFLDRHSDFTLELPTAVPDTMITGAGYFTTFPPRDGIDGAFAARFRNRSSSEAR